MQNGIFIIPDLYNILFAERGVGTFYEETERIPSAESYMKGLVQLISLKAQNEPISSRIRPIVDVTCKI